MSEEKTRLAMAERARARLRRGRKETASLKVWVTTTVTQMFASNASGQFPIFSKIYFLMRTMKQLKLRTCPQKLMVATGQCCLATAVQLHHQTTMNRLPAACRQHQSDLAKRGPKSRARKQGTLLGKGNDLTNSTVLNRTHQKDVKLKPGAMTRTGSSPMMSKGTEVVVVSRQGPPVTVGWTDSSQD
jgi:hypothetical protein